MSLYNETYLPDILNGIAQGLLIPTMAVIIILLLVSLFLVGQIIVETITERRHYKQNMAAIINEVNDAEPGKVVDIVQGSALLRYQKNALEVIARNMGLPEDPLFALAQTQISSVEKHYQRRVGITDVISKIGPMLGLMGTLIPLGPGIVALGNGQTALLSASLGVAFDATVCGLVCAVVSLIISKIRSGWYDEYVGSLEALATCILDKAATARKEGIILEHGFVGEGK